MTDISKLRSESEKAERDAQRLMADKDEALEKVRAQFGDKLRKANDRAAAAQKALSDAEAAQALAAREGTSDEVKRDIADRLGLELPT